MFLPKKQWLFHSCAAASCLRLFLKEIFQVACIGRSTNGVAFLVGVCDLSLDVSIFFSLDPFLF
jgi:hypothetical protein